MVVHHQQFQSFVFGCVVFARFVMYCGFQIGRERDCKHRTFAQTAIHGSVSVVQLRIFLHQVKPNAASGLVLLVLGLIKAIENLRLLVPIDSAARIRNVQGNFTRRFVGFNVQKNGSTWLSELKCIRKQVVHNLSQLILVDIQQYIGFGSIVFQVNAVFARQIEERRHDCFHKFTHIAITQVQCFAVHFQFAKSQQLVHQVQQFMRIARNSCKLRLQCFVVQFPDHRIERGNNQCERRSQFVAYVGEELEFQFIQFFFLLLFISLNSLANGVGKEHVHQCNHRNEVD